MEREDSLYMGDILKNAREEANLTQEEVARTLGIGRDAILRIEKGTRKIKAQELQNLVDLYDLNINDMFVGTLDDPNVSLKGIILAGGSGTRLYPITKGVSKQLLPVYDKPMIYYPLAVLMQAKIKDILIITTPDDQAYFKRLLQDGSQFGINLEYAVQPEPKGLAQAFTIGEKFIGKNPCAMVLGDNIFYGGKLSKELKYASINAKNGYATIFGYQVKDPQRFGIMELDSQNNVVSVEEKPLKPKSDYAITGLYFYPVGVSKKAYEVKPSARGEVEITTLNDMYLQDKKLKARLLGQEEYSWFDTGTFDSLVDATQMIQSSEENSDSLICSPEKIAYTNGWISDDELLERAKEQEKNSYGKRLRKVLGKK